MECAEGAGNVVLLPLFRPPRRARDGGLGGRVWDGDWPERGWLGGFRGAAGRASVSVKPGLMRTHVCRTCFDRDALGAIAQNDG